MSVSSSRGKMEAERIVSDGRGGVVCLALPSIVPEGEGWTLVLRVSASPAVGMRRQDSVENTGT